MACHFKENLRDVVQAHDIPRAERDAQEEGQVGIMGGDNNLRKRLDTTLKTDDLLAKAVVKKRSEFHGSRKNSSRRNRGFKERRASRSRSRSRKKDRRDSPTPRNRSSRKGGPGGSGSGKSGNSGGGGKGKSSYGKGKSSRDQDKKKQSKYFVSPSSFEEAWDGNFFSPPMLLLLTALGILIDKIPLVSKLPIGGRLRHCLNNWKKVTNNNWVCNVVENGYKIPFKYVPLQRSAPTNPPAFDLAFTVLCDEAEALKLKRAVVPVQPVDGQFISTYFAVPKARSPGKFRPILNLKRFNKNIKKYKFKLEGFKQVREWIQEGAWMCVLDLKDQFLHVPINDNFHKYLRFSWLGELLQWVVLPFGLRCSPRVVTKILRPVMAFLRTAFAILISIYIDDMLLQAATPEEAYHNSKVTALVLMSLGWGLNWEKSCFVPSQEVIHLGFVINTVSMTARCPPDKLERLQQRCKKAFDDGCLTVHECEKLLGTMESVRPVCPFVALHYRPIQRQFLYAKYTLKRPKMVMKLSKKSLFALKWWFARGGFASSCSTPLREPEPTLEIWTDSSSTQYGAYNDRGHFIQGEWDLLGAEKDLHISVLETRAARLAVESLTSPGDKVLLHIDNISACAYIRKQGGTRSYSLSLESCLLWERAISKNVFVLTPQWIGTKENCVADFLSRHDIHHWEFSLDRKVFNTIVDNFQLMPTLDAFASRQTAMLPRYMSWFQDPLAVARNALSNTWDPVTYLFPPTPLLPKVIQKLKEERVRAVLVVPQWPSALWWPLLVELLVEPPLPLPHYQQALVPMQEHQALPYLHPLVAMHLRG